MNTCTYINLHKITCKHAYKYAYIYSYEYLYAYIYICIDVRMHKCNKYFYFESKVFNGTFYTFL